MEDFEEGWAWPSKDIEDLIHVDVEPPLPVLPPPIERDLRAAEQQELQNRSPSGHHELLGGFDDFSSGWIDRRAQIGIDSTGYSRGLNFSTYIPPSQSVLGTNHAAFPSISSVNPTPVPLGDDVARRTTGEPYFAVPRPMRVPSSFEQDVGGTSSRNSSPAISSSENEGFREDIKVERSRHASKKYREKMREQIQTLKLGCESVLKTKQELQTRITSLNQEYRSIKKLNDDLKKRHKSTVTEVLTQKLESIKKLEQLLQSEASEEELTEQLRIYRDHGRKVILFGSSLINEMSEQESLDLMVVRAALDGTQNLSTGSMPDRNLESFINRSVRTIPGITAAQSAQLEELIARYKARAVPILIERERIATRLREARGGDTAAVNPQALSDTMVHLEHLRSNLALETQLYDEMLDLTIDVLTVRQHAMLMVKMSFENFSLLQLRVLWESLQNQEFANLGEVSYMNDDLNPN